MNAKLALTTSALVGSIALAAGPAAPAATPAGRPANIQQARVLSTPPAAAPILPAPPKSLSPSAPNQPATPPRNLPRGSLLDIMA